MKKNLCIISAAVLLASLLLGGCTKNPFSRKGELITFGTVSTGNLTRAAYGDDYPATGTPTLQRIDWESGDMVRIVSDNARVVNNGSNAVFADYTVSTVTPEADGSSSGAVVNTNPNGLAWTDADSYTFWAVYPSTTTISNAGVVSADFITATQALPTASTSKTVGTGDDAITYAVYTPALTNAVMTAVATGVKESDEKPQVKLHFKPAWTAIEFNLSSLDEAIKLTQIQLVASGSDYLAGSFTMPAGDHNPDPDSENKVFSHVSVDTGDTGSASKTVTIATEENQPLTLTKNTGVSLTMFLLPVANTSALRFRLTSEEGDGTKTSYVDLKKNGQPFVFEAGKKYRINGFKAPGSSWKIFIATDIMNVDDWGDPVDTEIIVE